MSFESLGDGTVKHAFSEAEIVSFPLLPCEELIDMAAEARERYAAVLHASCAQTGVPAGDAAYMVAKVRSEALDPNALFMQIQSFDGSIEVLRRSLRIALGVAGATPAERKKNAAGEVEKKITATIDRFTAARRRQLAIEIVNMYEPESPGESQAPADSKGFGDGQGGGGGASHPTQEPKGFPDPS
jgi:hypothetical protein